VHDKIRWRGSISSRDFSFLKSVTRQTPKTSMPGPMALHYLIGGSLNISDQAYPNLAEFFDDLVAAYHQEIAALAAAGCTYLHLDDVTFGLLCDPDVRAKKIWGFEADKLLRIYVDAFNRVVSARPDNMTVAIHICRGNRSGHWGAQGGYDPIADVLFNQLDVDAFFLEYDTPRAGSFEPLRFVPQNKRVVLGLISSKEPNLEQADDIKQRIEAASRFLPLEQLSLSPQCGFLTNALTIDDQRRKLSLVVKVAEDVWGTA
jgi:5-methyltetrahydropteroyltriglutamate--homocysteine methyltransferase